jgi:hypothetical protein
METGDKEIIEYTMGTGKVNLIAFVLIIPIIIILLLPYILIWDYETFELGREALMDYFLPVLIGGIVIHELLHGITWGYYSSGGMKSIKFGFKWKYLTPYCHCKEPIKVKHYRIGGAMPLIILGILPSLIAIVLGDGFLLSFGLFFTWAAGGDMIALFMLRNLDKEIFVSDHPCKMGFYREVDIEKQPTCNNK